jgi:hypothetical protein
MRGTGGFLLLVADAEILELLGNLFEERYDELVCPSVRKRVTRKVKKVKLENCWKLAAMALTRAVPAWQLFTFRGLVRDNRVKLLRL